MRLFSRARRAALATAAAGAMIVGLGATSAHAAVPAEGLVAEYLFSQASGATVPNSAAGSALGAATVRNVQPADWTGTALTMRGGAKTSTGNWVQDARRSSASNRAASSGSRSRARAASRRTSGSTSRR